MFEALALTAGILLIGAALVWFIYGEHLMQYRREGDNHGFDVTLVAMLGTFMPAIFCATLPWAS